MIPLFVIFEHHLLFLFFSYLHVIIIIRKSNTSGSFKVISIQRCSFFNNFYYTKFWDTQKNKRSLNRVLFVWWWSHMFFSLESFLLKFQLIPQQKNKTFDTFTLSLSFCLKLKIQYYLRILYCISRRNKWMNEYVRCFQKKLQDKKS